MKTIIKKIIEHLLPLSLKNKLYSIYREYIAAYYTKSYSQEGEDLVLRRIFENEKEGFYVDIGAHHPMRFSNTYLFYKQGWRGINVDAMPGSMRPFNRTRSRDINVEKPISSKKEVLKYYIFNEPALNGFSKDLSESRDGLKNQYKILDIKELETTTLKDLLENLLPQNQKINFMSVDVEGLDLEVLKSNDWSRYRPEIILVEILESSLDKIHSNPIAKYLLSKKYIPYAKCVNTVFFKKTK